MSNASMLEDTGSTRWIRVADTAALHDEACRRILDAAGNAISLRGEFLIVLAGGNTPRDVYATLRDAATDWSRWQIYFTDERCVAVNDPARNSRMAALAWLDQVPVPAGHIHGIPAELGATGAALAYADTLRGVQQFDLVLLGLGEDGHTAGLFPGHDYGSDPEAPDALALFDAPKMPLQRVSLSARRISHARSVLFLVAGEAKRNAVKAWLEGADIPARAIKPQAGIDILVESRLMPSASRGSPACPAHAR